MKRRVRWYLIPFFLLIAVFLRVFHGNSRDSRVTFLYKGMDSKTGMALLEPLLPALIGVEWHAGPFPDGAEALRCRAETETVQVIVMGDSVPSRAKRVRLRCGEREFMVAGIGFAN